MGTYVNNGKVNLGSSYDYSVAVQEIASLIGVGARSDGKIYLADLAQGAGINPLARCKPFSYAAWNFASDSARNTARNSVNNAFGTIPYITPSGSSTPHGVYTYYKPTGGASSPARIRDFDGYNHNAVSPISITFPSKIEKNNSNGVSVMLYNSSAGWDANSCLYIREMIHSGAGELYYALLVRRGSSYHLLRTSEPVSTTTQQRTFAIVFAQDATKLSSYQNMSNVYLVSFADLFVASDDAEYELTLVASSQKGSAQGVIGESTTAIGNPYSLEFAYGIDRKTVKLASGITGTTGVTGYLNTTWNKTAGSTSGDYKAYSLNGTSLKVRVTTPSGWTSTTLYVKVSISSSYGYFTNSAGTRINQLELGVDKALSANSTTDVTIADLSGYTIWTYKDTAPAITYAVTAYAYEGSADYKELERKSIVAI